MSVASVSNSYRPSSSAEASSDQSGDAALAEYEGHLQQLYAEHCPGGLAAWLTGGKEKQAPHLDMIDGTLRDMAEGRLDRGMLTMPPRHGKSRRAVRWGALWYLRRHPDRRVAIASYSAELAVDHGRWIRDTLEAHPELGVRLSTSSHAANRWDIDGTEGGLIAVGVGGSLTGRGAHLLLVDDPVKDDQEASSELWQRRTWAWWTSTALTRLEPGGQVLVIQTRWHQDDLAGQLLANERGKWRVTNLPAIAEDPQVAAAAAGPGVDVEDLADALGRAPGEPLWPDRYDAVALATIRGRVGERVWASLYQQRPRPIEGGVWKAAWIDDHRVIPTAMPDPGRCVVGVDPAASAGVGSDETGIIGVARAAAPGEHQAQRGAEQHAYVLADQSGRYSPAEWGRRACRLAVQLGADAIVIEDNQGGDMVAHVIRTAWDQLVRDREVRGMPPAVRQVKSKDGKRIRAEPIAQLYEQGRGHHVGAFEQLELQQVGWLPGGAMHDDRLDALVHGLTDLFGVHSVQVTSSRPQDRRLAGRR